jgi:hypothetical protein
MHDYASAYRRIVSEPTIARQMPNRPSLRRAGGHGGLSDAHRLFQRHVGAAPPDVPHRVLHSEVTIVVEVERAE